MATERIIYTDGACIRNPGPGGWAWVEWPDGDNRATGRERATTNQRMELTAIVEALKANDGDIIIVSDSTYCVDGINARWWRRWQRNGWTTRTGRPVANTDLWGKISQLAENRNVEAVWVKGHSGDDLNDLVDHLARHQATLASGEGHTNRRHSTTSSNRTTGSANGRQPGRTERHTTRKRRRDSQGNSSSTRRRGRGRGQRR